MTGTETKEGPRVHEACCVSRGAPVAGKAWFMGSFFISWSAGALWELLVGVIGSCIWQWCGSHGKEKVASFGRCR